jgi:aspartate aminotransferase
LNIPSLLLGSSNKNALISLHPMEVSKRLQAVSESQTIVMTQKAREMRNQGIDVISLSIGEPDFDTPDYIKEEAVQALKDGYTKYTPVPGFLELREAISEKFKRDNNLDYPPEQIVVSNGAKHSIMNVIMSYVNPDDEVIIPAPYWVSYTEMVKLAGGVPKIVASTLEQDYKTPVSEIKKVITGRTKLLIFSSPCNPSGSVWTQKELEELADAISNYPDILIVSDEIYEHIQFNGKHLSIGSIDKIKDQVITINGMSKGFAMTGWRIGYMGAPLWMAKACSKLQGQFTSGANAMAQRASIEALKHKTTELQFMTDAFKERRDYMVNALRSIKGFKPNFPQGAFYIFPDVSEFLGKQAGGKEIKTAHQLALYLLEEAHVSVVGGDSFGMNDCLRISYATSMENLKEAVSRIEKACSKIL